jgi:predicted nucleotidyltransferase
VTERLLAILRAGMPVLAERFGVRSLALFGSTVRGEATELSDVDTLVEHERAPTRFEFVRLQSHLTALLGLPVDLVMRSALNLALAR